MDTRSALAKQKISYSGCCGITGFVILSSSFINGLYIHPAKVVLVTTFLCMWTLIISINSNFVSMWPYRQTSILLCSLSIFTAITSSSSQHVQPVFSLGLLATTLLVILSALDKQRIQSYISLGITATLFLAGLLIHDSISSSAINVALYTIFFVTIYTLTRINYLPISDSLDDALRRAEIFSTIAKSSRELHTRETEEVIKNIVSLTKSLGYISVSIVSFDRRQKIYEEGVPITNVMDIAVRAAATRKVVVTKDESTTNPRLRDGDVVGVPIWINGRYSAALIAQSLPHVKVTQRDSEALELLADQAGRALGNASKAMMDRRVVERLTDESQRDKLTGLGNRRFADKMISNLKPGDVLAMIDLDGLKNTNDVYGHASGDELLSAVGSFLSEQIRDPDIAARLGGDEFMIILHNAQDHAATILERLRLMWQDRKIFDTTFSIGMAMHNSNSSPKETLQSADLALYEAKKSGKNRLVESSVTS